MKGRTQNSKKQKSNSYNSYVYNASVPTQKLAGIFVRFLDCSDPTYS